MSNLESIRAKHQSALAEISRVLTSNEFHECRTLATEYIYLNSAEYGMIGARPFAIAPQWEKWIVNPRANLLELTFFVESMLIANLKYPAASSRHLIEAEIVKAKEDMVLAQKAFFGSSQKLETARRRLESQEKRLMRFAELESHVQSWKRVLESFVAQCRDSFSAHRRRNLV